VRAAKRLAVGVVLVLERHQSTFADAGTVVMIVVTTNDLPGYRVVRVLGLARGLSVRSRSIAGNIGATFQILRGGNISIYTKLAETCRQEAFDLLTVQAKEMGANAIIAMRYDANEIASAVTEVLAYGTAVFVEPVAQ
jgi:uncharacterized protein YbjQ (UPF0145 family)